MGLGKRIFFFHHSAAQGYLSQSEIQIENNCQKQEVRFEQCFRQTRLSLLLVLVHLLHIQVVNLAIE